MESITIKVDERLLKEINNCTKLEYSTKTEFIRAAIRDKIKTLNKEKAMTDLLKQFGKSKSKTTNTEERKIREKVGKEFAKKFGIDLK